MEKLNILKQTVSKKIITRMANNGCGEDFYVSHAVIKQNFRGSTRDVTGAIQESECFEFGKAFTNGLLRKKE